ncbi:MAG: hypothetical protein QM752_01145 [Gammaproteobacteria bacterium]
MTISLKLKIYNHLIYITIFTGALACLWFSQATFTLKILATLLATGYFLYSYQQSRSMMQMIVTPTGDWEFHTQGGMRYIGVLQANSVVSPYFMLLNFTLNKKKPRGFSVLICQTKEQAELLRQLRVFVLT